MTITSIAAMTAATQSESLPSVQGLRDELAYLDQIQSSTFLREEGVKLAPKTLQKLRVIGGGPPFRKVMGRVFYEREGLRAWAEAQRSRLVTSTSELSAKPP